MILSAVILTDCPEPDDRPHEVQLTFDAYNHRLDNNDNFSPDDRWLVYDTRPNDGGIRMGQRIEKVHVPSGKIATIYRAPNPTITGPGIAAASYHPKKHRVVFIHGLTNHSESHPYDWWRRFGMMIDETGPQKPIVVDARDVVPPFTPGALRGGTHRHEFSGDGKWIGFTYNDALMATNGKQYSLRTIGVTKLDRPTRIIGTGDRANFSGNGTSALVVRVTSNPSPGSDEINRASFDSWIGTQGYTTADGRKQLARAFLGNVISLSRKEVSELFVVDIPSDLTVPGDYGPLEGTTITMPMPPAGAAQRRLTYTTDRRFPGFSGNVRSNADGSMLACRARDERGIDQVILASPVDGRRHQLTSFESNVQSDIRWHPNGTHVCFVQNNTIVLLNVENSAFRRVTSQSLASPFALVWSRNGNAIAFNRILPDNRSGALYAQIFIVHITADQLP